MNNEIDGFDDVDGNGVAPELIPKPGLCITCRKRLLNVDNKHTM
jgi:hypothetical protein